MSPDLRGINPSLIEVALSNTTKRKAFAACLFLALWGIATEEKGEPVSIAEYAEIWDESRATAYRNFDSFKKAFPGEETPDRLWALVTKDKAPDEMAAAVAAVMGQRWAS